MIIFGERLLSHNLGNLEAKKYQKRLEDPMV